MWFDQAKWVATRKFIYFIHNIRRITRLFPTVHYALNLRDADRNEFERNMERRYDFRYWFEDIAKWSRYFLFIIILFLKPFNCPYLWNQFQWGLLCNIVLQVMYTVNQKNENWIWVTWDSFCLVISHMTWISCDDDPLYRPIWHVFPV